MNIPNLDYQYLGACNHPSVQPQDFSPVDSRGRVDWDRARAIATRLCGGCPVRAQCLSHAVALAADNRGPQEMVWAGLWWPAANAADTTPDDLLTADEHAPQQGAAA